MMAAHEQSMNRQGAMSYQDQRSAPAFDAARDGRRPDDTAIRSQIGALCYRVRRGKVQVLLITSRGTGRWIVPKGWPLDGKRACDTARVEAFEEAGVSGAVRDICLGLYAYAKDIDTPEPVACMVALYPLQVDKLARKYPERGERKRKWVSRKRAAALVGEPELARLIVAFDPRALERGA